MAGRTDVSSKRAFLRRTQASWRRQTLQELTGRGVSAAQLIDFWMALFEGTSGVMPEFEPETSTTEEVVASAIIPLSRARSDNAPGMALASLWNAGQRAKPTVMVTHAWKGKLVHLVAGVVAALLDGRGPPANGGPRRCWYQQVVDELLLGRSGCARIKQRLQARGALGTIVFVCAFAVNQHAGICDRLNSCNCVSHKFSSGSRCEMNKFNPLMRRWRELVHVVVVGEECEVLERAWCVSEILQSTKDGIPQRIAWLSPEARSSTSTRIAAMDLSECGAFFERDAKRIRARVRKHGGFELIKGRILESRIIRERGVSPPAKRARS